MTETTPSPKRILVAEDEAIIRLDLAEMLGEAGYDVVGQASNGEQAVELATELRPDLVIMDVKMPVLDGISAAEQIGKERICPVVMLTAFSQTELVERARDAGVMAYIVKPFTAADLAPAIDIAVSRWAEYQALESEIADLSERLETRKSVDRAKGVLMAKLKLSEADAFRAQVAAMGPATTFLVDTYDIADGIRAAVAAAGPDIGAIRIDSGDLAVEAEDRAPDEGLFEDLAGVVG